jgi:hypothetical protein
MNALSAPESSSIQSILTTLFSWAVLAALSVIISGKLLAKRIPAGFNDAALFNIPLGIFRLEAKGDEVSLGIIMFIFSFTGCIIFGGKAAYELFREQAGIDIGQWNSLVVISSFLAVIVSTALCLILSRFAGQPVVDRQERKDVLEKLEDMSNGQIP